MLRQVKDTEWFKGHALMPGPITNFVLFHSDRGATIERVANTLESMPGVEVEITSRFKVVVQGDWTFTVYYAEAPHVLAESREIAEEYAVGRPDEDFIATCDRRFEVGWVPDPNMKYFNDWLLITHKVAALVDGVTLDAGGTLDDPKPHVSR